MKQKGYRATAQSFFLRVEILNALFIPEALRHNNKEIKHCVYMNLYHVTKISLLYYSL